MNSNWLGDEELKSFTDNFFDDLNHIDLPLEDIDTNNVEGDWEAKFQDLEPPPMDMFASLPSEFASCGITKGGRVGGQKTVPVLKKSISSEALSGRNSASAAPDVKVSKLFQSSSPVSVLENSDGSFSPPNSLTQRLNVPVKGLRSKRKPRTTVKLRCLLPLEPRKFEKFTLGESESESYYFFEQQAKKKRRIQPTARMVSSCLEASYSDGIVRKCSHCETTKTPQWREGPNGPKTLCNACGVRFRSGRLVPEYRPASSPTFIPSVHSNSHRKIIEMRRKEDGQFDTRMNRGVISGA